MDLEKESRIILVHLLARLQLSRRIFHLDFLLFCHLLFFGTSDFRETKTSISVASSDLQARRLSLLYQRKGDFWFESTWLDKEQECFLLLENVP